MIEFTKIDKKVAKHFLKLDLEEKELKHIKETEKFLQALYSAVDLERLASIQEKTVGKYTEFLQCDLGKDGLVRTLFIEDHKIIYYGIEPLSNRTYLYEETAYLDDDIFKGQFIYQKKLYKTNYPEMNEFKALAFKEWWHGIYRYDLVEKSSVNYCKAEILYENKEKSEEGDRFIRKSLSKAKYLGENFFATYKNKK